MAIKNSNTPKIIKVRKCRAPGCTNEFFPILPMQKVCCPKCAIAVAVAKREKDEKASAAAERRERREKLEAMKPRRHWIAEAKKAMHRWVRLRDEGKPCISCGRPLVSNGKFGGDFDAGHYRSVGSAKHLEFVEWNVHGQCKVCNNHLAGNHVAYRAGLIVRIGLAAVDELEADQAPRRYSVEDLKALKAHYSQLAKALEHDRRVEHGD